MSFFAFSLRYLYKSDTPGTEIPHILAVTGSIIGFGIIWFIDKRGSPAYGSNGSRNKSYYRRLITYPAAFSINILSLFYYTLKSSFSIKMTLVNNLLNKNKSRKLNMILILWSQGLCMRSLLSYFIGVYIF